MKVIILGKDDMLANLIRGALLAKTEIVGVLRYENLRYSKLQLFFRDFFKSSPALTLIKKHKLYDMKFCSANLKEFKKEVLKLNADLILVGTWAEKLDNEIINMPTIGTVNVHPSLLPAYRGPNPYLQTILHGEKFSGITFHLMTDKLDAGGILAQDKVEILECDTGKELRNKTVFRARLLCARLLEKLKNGCVEPTEQDENLASYYPDIKPEDMTLNFKKETSVEIIKHVRAFYPFAPTYIEYKNKFYIVNPYKMTHTDKTGKPEDVIEFDKNSITVVCKDGIAVKFSQIKKYNKIFK